jgi:hypothetical protein
MFFGPDISKPHWYSGTLIWVGPGVMSLRDPNNVHFFQIHKICQTATITHTPITIAINMLIRHILVMRLMLLLLLLLVVESSMAWTILHPSLSTTAFLHRRVARQRPPPHAPIFTTCTTHLASSLSPPVGGGAGKMKKKKLTSFPRYLEVECWKRQDLRGLESVLQSFAEACKQMSRIIQRAQTDDVYGYYNSNNDDAADTAISTNANKKNKNVQGEVQQKLDVLCNTILLRAFCGGGRQIHSVASEEEDDPRCCSDVMVRFLCCIHSFHLFNVCWFMASPSGHKMARPVEASASSA